MAKEKITLATVLAFEKKLVPSDGFLYGTTWDRRGQQGEPVRLIEKSVRGTISNRLKGAVKNDPVKLNAEVEKANLQTVDAAALSMDQDTVQLHFTLKVLAGAENPSACNEEAHKLAIQKMGENYRETFHFTELARRYAFNIAAGRFLWRNRVGAEKVEVTVKVLPDEKTFTFDAYQYSLKNFDAHDAALDEVASLVAAALRGEKPYLLLDITANALVGRGQEVYPSEELILDKGKGTKSKVLYASDGVAAMHSQKIGNAIRQIDTWYPEYETAGVGPIAVEPYGAVTTLGRAFRSPKEKEDFYTLFDGWSQGEELTPEEQHFVMAVLIRGGVFGASGKD